MPRPRYHHAPITAVSIAPLLLCVSIVTASAQTSNEPIMPTQQPLHMIPSLLPTATGLVITYIAEGSQAEQLGLQLGDIVTRYGSHTVTDQASLAAAIKASGDGSHVLVVTSRAEPQQQAEFAVVGGTLGVAGLAAINGQDVNLLPPTSDVVFDRHTTLPATRVLFERFLLDGKHAGYGQTALIPHPEQTGVFMLESEYAFDGGEDWGPQHYVVRQEYAFTDSGIDTLTARQRPYPARWLLE